MVKLPIWHKKPKSLAEMQATLTKEDHANIRSISGKDFTDNVQSQVMLKMDKKPNVTASFHSKKGVIEYMGRAMRYEKLDPVKTANENFVCKANQTEEQITLAKCEKYLNSVESTAIFSRSDETQYKGKLAGSMQKFKAYEILTNIKNLRKVGQTLEVWLAKEVEISQNQLDHMLKEAKAVGGYMDVNKLEIIV